MFVSEPNSIKQTVWERYTYAPRHSNRESYVLTQVSSLADRSLDFDIIVPIHDRNRPYLAAHSQAVLRVMLVAKPRHHNSCKAPKNKDLSFQCVGSLTAVPSLCVNPWLKGRHYDVEIYLS